MCNTTWPCGYLVSEIKSGYPLFKDRARFKRVLDNDGLLVVSESLAGPTLLLHVCVRGRSFHLEVDDAFTTTS